MPSYKYIEKADEARQQLRKYQQEEDIAFLAMDDLFGFTRTKLVLDGTEQMSQDEIQRYDLVISSVCQGVPYQYTIGFSWFYGEKFIVNPDVLIPRNETEELVELILKKVPDDGRTVADIGTGTGVIPITLKKYWRHNLVYATDISTSALDIARKNSEAHHTDIFFLEGDLLAPIREGGLKLDILISNPPYISRSEIKMMTPSVVEHEPHIALFAEDDGLYLYKKMIDGLADVMNDGGMVFFEIGFRQAEILCQYIKSVWPAVTPQVDKDINGNPRILHFEWER
jgi:release factor glutamine methyltransferase